MTLPPEDLFVLGEALVPPSGYEADAVVATTYSLDMPMALAVPLALIRQGEFAGADVSRAHRWTVLEALRRFGSKYRVFCDGACLHPPSKRFKLAELLNKVIVPVAVPPVPEGRRPSFHPKLVVLRFVSEGRDPVHRLVCMSRNLASSTAFDVGVVLEGSYDPRPPRQQRSHALAGALRTLPAWASRDDQRASARALTEDLAASVGKVRWEPPEGFDEVALWPLGFGATADPILPREPENRLLVISPFIGARRIADLAPAGENRSPNVLVSNLEALEAVGSTARSRFDRVLAFSAGAFSDRVSPEDGTLPSEPSGLHAKVFVAEARGATRWMVGSANATEAAVSGNAELVIELATRRRALRIDKLLGEDGLDSLLLDVTDQLPDGQNPADPADRSAEQLLRELVAAGLVGDVNVGTSGGYEVDLRLSQPVPGVPGATAHARLLYAEWEFNRLDLSADPAAHLGTVPLLAVSHFVVVRVVGRTGAQLERVVGIKLRGLDEETLRRAWQEKAISEGGDPMEYVASVILGAQFGAHVMLFDDEGQGDDPHSDARERIDSGGVSDVFDGRPLLEKLLRLARDERASSSPGRMADLADAVEAYRADLPESFLDMWNAVYSAYRSGDGWN